MIRPRRIGRIKPIRRITKTISPIIIRASGRYNISLIRIWIRPLAKGKHFLFFNANNEDQRGGSKKRVTQSLSGTSHDPYASHNYKPL